MTTASHATVTRVSRRTQIAWVAERDAWKAAGGTFATWMEARRRREPAAIPETPLGAALRHAWEHYLLTGRSGPAGNETAP